MTVSAAPQHLAFELFAGLGVVLLVASAVGYVLKLAIAHGEPHGGIDDLNARIKSWWLMVLVIAGAFLAGRPGLTILFLFASFAALREFVGPGPSAPGSRASLPPSVLLVLGVQYVLVYLDWYGIYAVFVPLYALLCVRRAARASDRGPSLDQALRIQQGLVLCVFCLSHVPALLALNVPGYEDRNLLLVLFLLVVVQSSDVLQYVWGKLLGRRRVAPRLSPSKTWEGLIGGVASATALGAALFWITPFTPWQAALLALVVNLLGFFGGLTMSAIKRSRGIKDWGHLIRGHGGVLDRLDSVVFAAPVFFYATRIGWG